MLYYEYKPSYDRKDTVTTKRAKKNFNNNSHIYKALIKTRNTLLVEETKTKIYYIARSGKGKLQEYHAT